MVFSLREGDSVSSLSSLQGKVWHSRPSTGWFRSNFAALLPIPPYAWNWSSSHTWTKSSVPSLFKCLSLPLLSIPSPGLLLSQYSLTSCFLWIKGTVMACKNPTQLYSMAVSTPLFHVRLLAVLQTALSSLGLLCPHSLLLHLYLKNPHSFFMVQPGHLFLWEVLSFPPTSLAWFSASHMSLSSCTSLI